MHNFDVLFKLIIYQTDTTQIINTIDGFLSTFYILTYNIINYISMV